MLRIYHEHLQRHKISVLECECNIEFKSLQEKKNHMKLIHKSHVKCDRCNYTHKDNQSLEKHHGKTITSVMLEQQAPYRFSVTGIPSKTVLTLELN